jgi:hypothetical protein
MSKAQGHSKTEDEPFTLADSARLVGIALVLGAFLMLTFTPQLVFLAWHRDGYARTEAESLSGPGRSRSFRVRIASSGEELSVRRTSFDSSPPYARLPVWYNPSARLVVGITLFDMRVVSLQRYPELPNLVHAFTAVAINLILAAVGGFLVFRSPKSAQDPPAGTARRRR